MWKPDTRSQRVAIAWRVAYAWANSFRKSEWTIDDYPLRFREQDLSDYCGSERLRPVRWGVNVVRWGGMQGFGNTREEAMVSLNTSFANYVASEKKVPRPGIFKKFELEFASEERVSKFCEFEEDFIRDVLGMEWALMTDESSLWDFHTDENNDQLYEKIREVYGIDVSGIEDAKIVDVLAEIASSTSSVPQQPSTVRRS